MFLRITAWLFALALLGASAGGASYVPYEESQVLRQNTTRGRIVSGERFFVWVIATGYCPCAKCCGRTGALTAGGDNPLIADGIASNRLPLRARVFIPGVGMREVDDALGRKERQKPFHRIDIRFRTHAKAKAFGVQRVQIRVLSLPLPNNHSGAA